MASDVVDVVGLAAARLPELKRLLDDSSDGLPVRALARIRFNERDRESQFYSDEAYVNSLLSLVYLILIAA